MRFTVTKVVDGAFSSDEVRRLTHSPSQDGIRSGGQKFVLCLNNEDRTGALAAWCR